MAVISASSIEARRTARWVSLVNLTATGSRDFKSSTNSFSRAASSPSLAASRLINPIVLSCSAVKVPAESSSSSDWRGPTSCERTAVFTAAGKPPFISSAPNRAFRSASTKSQAIDKVNPPATA